MAGGERSRESSEIHSPHCTLDAGPPLPDVYPDAVESLRETLNEARPDSPDMPRGFGFYDSSNPTEWWNDEGCWDRGLPSMVRLED